MSLGGGWPPPLSPALHLRITFERLICDPIARIMDGANLMNNIIVFWNYLVKKCQRVQYQRIRVEDSEFQIHVFQNFSEHTFFGPTRKSLFRVPPTGLFRSMKSTLLCIIREFYLHTTKKRNFIRQHWDGDAPHTLKCWQK